MEHDMMKTGETNSAAAPFRKCWNAKDAEIALNAEREAFKNDKYICITFPDGDINIAIVNELDSLIQCKLFKNSGISRKCIIQLREDSDIPIIIDKLNKISFNNSTVKAELKIFDKVPKDSINVIYPYELSVTNIPTDVTLQTIETQFPKAADIKLGYNCTCKNRRKCAFISFDNVEDAVEAYTRNRNSMLSDTSIFIQFSRMNTRNSVQENAASKKKLVEFDNNEPRIINEFLPLKDDEKNYDSLLDVSTSGSECSLYLKNDDSNELTGDNGGFDSNVGESFEKTENAVSICNEKQNISSNSIEHGSTKILNVNNEQVDDDFKNQRSSSDSIRPSSIQKPAADDRNSMRRKTSLSSNSKTDSTVRKRNVSTVDDDDDDNRMDSLKSTPKRFKYDNSSSSVKYRNKRREEGDFSNRHNNQLSSNEKNFVDEIDLNESGEREVYEKTARSGRDILPELINELINHLKRYEKRNNNVDRDESPKFRNQKYTEQANYERSSYNPFDRDEADFRSPSDDIVNRAKIKYVRSARKQSDCNNDDNLIKKEIRYYRRPKIRRNDVDIETATETKTTNEVDYGKVENRNKFNERRRNITPLRKQRLPIVPDQPVKQYQTKKLDKKLDYQKEKPDLNKLINDVFSVITQWKVRKLRKAGRSDPVTDITEQDMKEFISRYVTEKHSPRSRRKNQNTINNYAERKIERKKIPSKNYDDRYYPYDERDVLSSKRKKPTETGRVNFHSNSNATPSFQEQPFRDDNRYANIKRRTERKALPSTDRKIITESPYYVNRPHNRLKGINKRDDNYPDKNDVITSRTRVVDRQRNNNLPHDEDLDSRQKRRNRGEIEKDKILSNWITTHFSVHRPNNYEATDNDVIDDNRTQKQLRRRTNTK